MPRARLDRHSTDEVILDASRGLLPLGGNTRARAHFSFCAPCRHTVDLWRRFEGITRGLREAEPPEAAVGKAKALARVPPRVSGLTRMKTAVGYENLWAPPSAAGARGVPSDQVVYQVEEFAVDLRISRERASVVIVGQITDLRRPARRFSRVVVTLLADDRVVVRAFSNDRGEFHVECREHDPMWIEVVPQKGRLIRIPVRPKQMAS